MGNLLPILRKCHFIGIRIHFYLFGEFTWGTIFLKNEYVYYLRNLGNLGNDISKGDIYKLI